MPEVDLSGGITPVSILANTVVFASSAMTLVVGLAWNEAFKEYFASNAQLKKYGPWVYALLVTFIALVVINLFINTKDSIARKIQRQAQEAAAQEEEEKEE